jgi:hypothetical protein
LPSFHVARLLFGDNKRKNRLEAHGYDLSDNFLDDIIERYWSVLFGMLDPFVLWDEHEEGGFEG